MNLFKSKPIQDAAQKIKHEKQKYWLKFFGFVFGGGGILCLLIGIAMCVINHPATKDQPAVGHPYLIKGIVCLVLFALFSLIDVFCWVRWKSVKQEIVRYIDATQNNARE
jgi:hypothetical protein